MKILIFFLFYFMITNCSLNKNSKYWTEESMQKKTNSKKLIKIIKKSNDIRLMNVDEYKIYMDDYIKKSKYPDINK